MKLHNVINIFTLLFAFGLTISCSESSSVTDEEIGPELKGVSAEMATMETSAEITQSAISDFVVNKDNLDPTKSTAGRTAWLLDVQIYKGSTPYQYGAATCTWNSTDQTWDPPVSTVYFPNYTRQLVSAKLYPSGWTGTIKLDQSLEADLIAQDILTQNGNTTVTVYPAHIPTIPMRHGNSMIDFILTNVDETHIADIKVYVGGSGYTPHKIATTGKLEYLVILPVGAQNPQIRLTTTGGAQYIQPIGVASTQANVCYCINLRGINLLLSSFIVTDWTYGQALSGEYSTITSYPTFKGDPNTSATIYFLNGSSQTLNFNSRGEATVKPLGRTIIRIVAGTKDFAPNPPIVLRSMLIDLKPHIDNET